jgi:hypothetical protein
LISTQTYAWNSKINKSFKLSLLKRATSIFTLFRSHRQFPGCIERRMDAVDYIHILLLQSILVCRFLSLKMYRFLIVFFRKEIDCRLFSLSIVPNIFSFSVYNSGFLRQSSASSSLHMIFIRFLLGYTYVPLYIPSMFNCFSNSI